jgi:tetratricopeptide (TPR) repeat protein
MHKPKSTKGEPQSNIPKNRKTASISERTGAAPNLSRAIVILGCFILFLPLLVDYSFYSPHIFLKSMLFRVTVQVMALLYVILAVISPEHRPRFTRISCALMAYFSAIILSSLPGVSASSWYSWWGDFGRMNGVFAQLHLLIYLLILTQTLKRDREWLTLFTASLFAAVLMGATGLIQSMGLDETLRSVAQEPRSKGAIGNANFFASYMMLNIFLAAYFLVRKDRKDVYPYIAKIWLFLLILLDLFLVIRDVVTGNQFLANALGMAPIALFAFLLHGIALIWFFLRRTTWAGTGFLIFLCPYYLFWMIQSQTRGTLLGLAGSLALFSIFYLFGNAGRKMKWVAGLLILFVATLPFFLRYNRNSDWIHSHATLSRLANTSLEESRFLAWKAATDGIFDRPLFGWGPENYRSAFDLHAPAGLFSRYEPNQWFDRAHNQILDIGATTGLLGLGTYLVFYILVFIFLISHWFRTNDPANSLLLAVLLMAYLIQGLVTFDTINTDVILFLVLAYIVYLSGNAKPSVPERSMTQTRTPITWRGYLIIASATGILVSANIYTVHRPCKSNLLLQSAIDRQKALSRQSPTTLEEIQNEIPGSFQAAAAYRTTGRYEVREAFAGYARGLANTPEVPLNIRFQIARKALDLLEESIREEPLSMRHALYFAMIFGGVRQVIADSDPVLAGLMTERNLLLLQKMEHLAPTRPQVLLEQAQSLVSLNRLDDAITVMEKVIALNFENKEPYIDLVVLYILTGRFSEAERQWQKIKSLSFQLTESDYERIIGLYAARKHYADVIALYREQLRATPDDPILLARLANAYRESGDMNSARQSAFKAATLSPQLIPELQDLLR